MAAKEEADDKASKDSDDAEVWYFAIGSMMLPQSCEFRHFYPRESKAAELYDFRLHFFSPRGYAEAVPDPGHSMHGVMHRVTKEQMVQLDQIENGYIRQSGMARPYDNKPAERVEVTVYCRTLEDRQESAGVDGPPQQRYIEILIAGAEHFGIEQPYIDRLKQQPFAPRRLPHEFESLGSIPPDAPTFGDVPTSPEECGCAPGTELFSVNGKVIALKPPKPNTPPPDKAEGAFTSFLPFMKNKYGPHIDVALSQLLYDLKYGAVKHWYDCTKEHGDHVEDAVVQWLRASHGEYTILGTLERPTTTA